MSLNEDSPGIVDAGHGERPRKVHTWSHPHPRNPQPVFIIGIIMLGLSHSPHIMKKLTQQIGDNEANIGELSPWSCKREIPKKGGKECWSINPVN